ncbi:MAG: hypothetical protein ACREBN_11925 [Burkholderiaceae bacterium]
MMAIGKSARAAVIFGFMLAALIGCQKKEGPAEKAGQAIDNAAAKVGQQVEKAGEAIQDAAKGEKK